LALRSRPEIPTRRRVTLIFKSSDAVRSAAQGIIIHELQRLTSSAHDNRFVAGVAEPSKSGDAEPRFMKQSPQTFRSNHTGDWPIDPDHGFILVVGY
jgi:hypothetical protein